MSQIRGRGRVSPRTRIAEAIVLSRTREAEAEQETVVPPDGPALLLPTTRGPATSSTQARPSCSSPSTGKGSASPRRAIAAVDSGSRASPAAAAVQTTASLDRGRRGQQLPASLPAMPQRENVAWSGRGSEARTRPRASRAAAARGGRRAVRPGHQVTGSTDHTIQKSP